MNVEVGQIFKGTVSGITKFGAFVKLENGKSGMVHISEISNSYITEIKDHLSEGQEVTVKVISIDEKGRIGLSIKKAMENGNSSAPARNQTSQPSSYSPPQRKAVSFEDMLQKFKQDTDEKFSDVKGQKESRKANYEKRSRK